MNADAENAYKHIRGGRSGFYEQERGLIAVWGKEAVPFLDGLITNDVKTLENGQQMLAAFPNAQGRLLAVVRVLRRDDRYLFETEQATREKVYQNLFRFTFAGDFFVEDLTAGHRFGEVFNCESQLPSSVRQFRGGNGTVTLAIPNEEWAGFCGTITDRDHVEISDELYETLRIENGVPRYGVDADETTVVSELGLDGLISYNKGCYIGQEIIARIHFRGHVAKQLTGLMLAEPVGGVVPGVELTTSDAKNAGKITSVTHSPKLDRTIALGYVRYDHLSPDTELIAGETKVTVHDLPFVE